MADRDEWLEQDLGKHIEEETGVDGQEALSWAQDAVAWAIRGIEDEQGLSRSADATPLPHLGQECTHERTTSITRLSGPPLIRCVACQEVLSHIEGRSSVLGGRTVTGGQE